MQRGCSLCLTLAAALACSPRPPRSDAERPDSVSARPDAGRDSAPADSLPYRILSPAPGDEWHEGGTYVIRWTAARAGEVNVAAAVGGKDRGHLAMRLPAGTDSLRWTVPEGFVTGFGPERSDEVRIRIESADDPAVGVTSEPFAVSRRLPPP
jgi:hypothetical protein